MTSGRHSDGLVKLSGTIAQYVCQRYDASFFFTEADDLNIGMVAVTAALAGVSGPAVAIGSYSSTEEPADYLEFELSGQAVKGWVWHSPFKQGDVVEVAAEWRGDHYELAAIVRPVDGVIALYPHCSRGTSRHIKNAIKWWFLGSASFNTFVVALMFLGISLSANPLSRDDLILFLYGSLGALAFFGLMTFSLARKWMPFVRLTERVCRVLDFPDPGNVDLVKSSKILRTPDDDGAYGHLYFRYR